MKAWMLTALVAALCLLCNLSHAEVRHRFLAVDNGANHLLYVDQFAPESSWRVAIPPGSRDLQVLSKGRVLVSHGTGAAEYDLGSGRRLGWQVTGLKQCNSARRLDDGRTLLGCNSAEGVRFYEADESGSLGEKPIAVVSGVANLRLFRMVSDDRLLFTVSDPFRTVVAQHDGSIVWSAPLEGKGYKAIRLPNGNTVATTGGTCTVTEISPDGEVVWRVGGKDVHGHLGLDWFSGFDILPNGHVVVANWLGHGKHGTGPHLVEFDRENRLVWQWKDHDLARQITNVLILDDQKQAATNKLARPADTEAELASLSVTAEQPLRTPTLRTNSRINTNRIYRFRDLPEWLDGLAYTSHQHKNPASMTCTVSRGGVLYLLVGDGATVAEGKEEPAWRRAGRLKGTDASAVRDWMVYRAQVSKGQQFRIDSPNKWGAVLAAAEIVLPKGVVLDAASREYRFLESQLKHRPDSARRERLRRECAHRQALIWDEDRDPLDIVLRRTQALLADLQRLPGCPDLSAEEAHLTTVSKAAGAASVKDAAARRALFRKVCAVRRRIAFSNPLLSFDRIAFLTHFKSRMTGGSNHMCDQYFGFNAIAGGRLYVLNDAFSERPEAEDVLADSVVRNGRLEGSRLVDMEGAFISLELSYDARTAYFAWTEAVPDIRNWRPETCYHIFRVGLDGQGLTQLTDGPYNDFDPCCLPDGRLAFISERRGGYGRCHGRPVPTYTLHSMNADGSGIRALSYHETNEWHPSVDHNGMVVYSRWDYVDRDSDIAHHIWLCFPDGRDPRSYHGNYPVDRHSRPWMELSLRAIPDSHRYVGVAAPHHGQAYGSLVRIDHRPPDDNSTSQIKRITPTTAFAESERGRLRYGTPWPLSESYYLCVFDWDGHHYGIYLVDVFGNHELIWEDMEVPCLDPMPLRPRQRPPVIPPMVSGKQQTTTVATGRVAVMNVYEADFEWPEKTQIEALRIVQVFPKSTPNTNHPNIGAGNQSLARGVIGTVPVEADGSAYFTMPANVAVYFQALDEKGQAVQGMRSDTYVKPGELLSCLGCHEHKRTAGPTTRSQMPSALRRSPSTPQPETEDAYPLTFSRLVQPVLDTHCVACHAKSAKAPDLDGGDSGRHGWSRGFNVLRRFAYARHGGNGAIKRNRGSRSIAGETGAQASRLLSMLEHGHHGVELPAQDLRRITLWLDCNSNFYGAYIDTEEQAAGTLVMPRIQ